MNLIAPENRETPRTTERIAPCLLDHCLENGHGLVLPADPHGDGKLHSWLVVVLCSRERCKASALTGRVIEAHGDLSSLKLAGDVDAISTGCQLRSILEGEKGTEGITSSSCRGVE